ncbi:hypothetical protein [Bradyrhizobium sp. BWA-3-5]|uniref:hypothetical protein n=1 Tax=Bradyrhizobium sp. BWA-3-5 TaxID=3080013 RepID=UPI00293F47BD|nr:hypothetical protein [Bradyrhizobium sp. BWA-3-5]WOH65326.1 hypothetical protein RX331_33055 [Bradyrhizobium sp. BWA-3-5]
MSGHLRLSIAAFVVLTSLPTSASSNPLADVFGASPPPAAPELAPAEKERECSSRPGTSTADGQRWVYRTEGGRKCWFQTAEGNATVKQVRDRVRAAKARVVGANETARKRKAVMEARAEMLRSAPVEAPEPPRPAPEVKVVDVAPVQATGAATFVPAVPVAAANQATDQPAPDQPTPRRLDEKTLLAAAPAPSDAVAVSVPPAAQAAAPIAARADDGPGWTATWLGVLLMALGLAVVLGSSRTVREAVLLRD